MTFRIEILVQSDLAALVRPSEHDEYREVPLSPHAELAHVLSAQCQALAATGGVSFRVGGFGQDRWPVDVATDLAVVIEQLPEVLVGLQRENEAFPLNFYEQGIERYLTGTRRGHEVELECMTTSLQWAADPSVEHVRTEDIENMLHDLRDSYSAAVDIVCPWLAHVPAFEKWTEILDQGQPGARRKSAECKSG